GADLVVRLRPELRGEREALADLDAFYGLDAHYRRGEPRIEPVFLRGVGAEPRRHAAGPHLDDAADRVARLPRHVDPLLQRLLVDRRALHLDPDRREQRLRHPADGDVHRGVPRRGALERVADVVEAVLLDAGEIGV